MRKSYKSKITKQALTVRYDIEVIEDFKATGEGWQNRMNAVLKDWLKAPPWLRKHPANGPSVADAVRILLKRVVDEQAFPLEFKVPNTETRTAIQDLRALKIQNYKSCSVGHLFSSIFQKGTECFLRIKIFN